MLTRHSGEVFNLTPKIYIINDECAIIQTLVIFDGHSHKFVWCLCFYCFIPCTFLPDSGTKFSGPSFSSDSSVTIDDGTLSCQVSSSCHHLTASLRLIYAVTAFLVQTLQLQKFLELANMCYYCLTFQLVFPRWHVIFQI